MRASTKDLIYEFIGGILFSLIGFLFFIWIDADYSFENTDIHTMYFGFMGLPLGSIVGIFLINKFFLKYQGVNILGLILGLVMSCLLGGIISILILDKYLAVGAIFVPIIFTFFSLVGFHYTKSTRLLLKIFLKN